MVLSKAVFQKHWKNCWGRITIRDFEAIRFIPESHQDVHKLFITSSEMPLLPLLK